MENLNSNEYSREYPKYGIQLVYNNKKEGRWNINGGKMQQNNANILKSPYETKSSYTKHKIPCLRAAIRSVVL